MKLSVWKDRPNRVRIMALYDGKHEEARRYFYRQYHPDENIKGFRILQLDMNPWNFEKDNLVKITPRIMNCLLNNNLLSKDVELNKMAIKTLELEFLCKDIK
jgi:poly(3-hydroxyalkanoate) synthetase